jgi:hypothetical protein
MSSDASHAGSALPAIDDHLVEPETRYEMYDGELVYVSPAKQPHSERHVQLSVLIAIHKAPGFGAGIDLLTRTSEIDDVAPDVSLYPDAPDPETGDRQLEHLAFEVVSTESLSHAGDKAARLVARGVRRVFAIDVGRSRVLEWSPALDNWSVLDAAGRIEDLSLAIPLPVEMLIRAAEIDDAVAEALLAKGNPVLEAKAELDWSGGHAEGWVGGHEEGLVEGHAEGLAEGHAEGLAEGTARGRSEAVLAVLAARGILLDGPTRERILGEPDPQRLERWIARAIDCATIADLFAEP